MISQILARHSVFQCQVSYQNVWRGPKNPRLYSLSQIYPHWNWNPKLNTKLSLEFQFEYGFKLEFQVELSIIWESVLNHRRGPQQRNTVIICMFACKS